MARKAFAALGMVVGLTLLYLAVWPVPIDPVAWEPPAPPPPEGPFAPNTALVSAERIPVALGVAPEDVDVDTLGRIYGGLANGKIVRLNPDGTAEAVFAETGGRPLGLAFDDDGHLLVADADKGLLRVQEGGQIDVLSTTADGVPFGFTDDLDVGPDGVIYFSDASYRFAIEDYVLDLIEHRPSGRLLAYDPASGTTTVLLDSLHFANGIAVGPGGDYVLVNETGSYRVLRYWLRGARKGETEVWLDNLPSFPDGISYNGDGLFWVALVSPRNALMDRLAPYPWLRKVVVRLPKALHPKPERSAALVGVDTSGVIRHYLNDPEGRQITSISSVEQVGDTLYLGSLVDTALARIAVPR